MDDVQRVRRAAANPGERADLDRRQRSNQTQTEWGYGVEQEVSGRGEFRGDGRRRRGERADIRGLGVQHGRRQSAGAILGRADRINRRRGDRHGSAARGAPAERPDRHHRAHQRPTGTGQHHRRHAAGDAHARAPGRRLGIGLPPALRGVKTDNSRQAQADASVAYFIDGVYQAANQEALASFVDVARVEVLRGPQGTLFGRNSFGGAISITSNLPTNRFEGSLEAEGGNYGENRFQGIINIPVTDTLKFRLSPSPTTTRAT